MATILNTPLPPKAGGARPESYNYDEWMTPDKQGNYPVVLLVRGTDFDSTPASMKTSITGAAKKRNLKAHTRSLPRDAQERKALGLTAESEGLIFQVEKVAE